jgi:alpha-2-macroglobulin
MIPRRRLLTLVLLVVALGATYAAWHWHGQSKKADTAGKAEPFVVLAVTERSLDGRPALAILFNAELKGSRSYDRHITLRTTGKQAKVVEGGWVMSEDRRALYFSDIEPETGYQLLIAAELADDAGRVLGESVTHDITTNKVVPAYGFASQGAVLPRRVTEGLPIVTVNVDEVAIEFLRVKDDSLAQFLNNYYWQSRTHAETLEGMAQYTESAYYGRFTVRGEKNARIVTQIPVQDIDKLREPGLYIAVMSRPGHFGWEMETAYFFISDIGLHARRYAQRLEVYSSALADGQPMAGVEIELRDAKGKRIAEAETDREGRAQFDAAFKTNQILVARKGKDLALLAFNQPALDLSGFNAAGASAHPLEVFVYSPRDLYRPGETVDFGLLLRDHDGKAVKDQPLLARLARPDGKTIRNLTLEPQALGYYQAQVEIPDDAPVGQWRLLVYTDPASKQAAGDYPFKVEDFLPERMKLVLDSAQATLTPGQPWQVSIQGDYLYGAPAAGNRVTSVLNVRPELHPLEAFKDFHFGDVNESNERQREELPELRLDEKGQAKVEVDVAGESLNSPLTQRLTVSLYETGGRPVVRSLSRVVWPADALVGIRPLFSDDTSPGNGRAEFEIIKAGANGKTVAAQGLLVKLVREDREYYWSFSDENGWTEQYSEQNFDTHSEVIDLAPGQPSRLAVPVEYGRYRLDVHDPKTQRTARYRFYAGWGQRDDQTGPDRVMLKLDKARYTAGDTLRLEVLPPHAGSALVQVETTEKVLWSDRVKVPAEGRTLKIPVGKDWDRHDIYISVIVLRPGNVAERVTPNRALGLIHLPLARDERQLKPTLTAATKMRPQQPLQVAVAMPELKGQQAYVTLAAVDVGVLNITRFQTPDPFKFFFQQRRFGVDLYDLYGKVIETLDGKRAGLRFGGDEDASADRSKLGKAEVRIVSLFSGPVAVGKDGVAQVVLDIPDFNGTLRLMALAYGADRFGSAEAEVVVAAPVVAEIATPRFLAPGDRTRVTLDLTNLSGSAQTLDVKLSSNGPVVANGTQSVQLENGKRKTIQLPLSADENFGIGQLRVQVSNRGGAEPVKIDRQWELAVRPAWPGDRRVRLQRLDAGEGFALAAELANGLMPETVDASLSMSSQAPLNLREAVQGLLGYPYGCAEQTASAAFPLLYLDESKARELGLKPLAVAERNKRIEYAFGKLAGLQVASGGFAVWPGNPEDPWITPYVTDFLLHARDQGYAVPETVLKSALDRLLQRLQSGGDLNEGRWTQSPAHLGFASKAYAGYVLARVQRAPLGSLRTLYDNHRKNSESGLGLVQLGIAMALQGDREQGRKAVAEGLAKTYPRDRYLGDYGSAVRDDALMLALVTRHADVLGGQPLVETLILRLADALRGRQWHSTQDRFAIFLAGEALNATKPQPWQAELNVGGTRETVAVERRLLRGFDIDALRSGVRVQPQAGFPLYAATAVTGYAVQPPKPRDDVIKIRRGYYDLDGKALGTRALKTGEMILVYIELDSGSTRIEDALVTDLVPAGLEVENLNISDGETLQNVLVEGVDPAQAMNAWPLKYQEYRGDRYVAAISLYGYGGPRRLYYLARVVTPGTFRVPPPFVEDMYRPEIFGIGETPATIEVIE